MAERAEVGAVRSNTGRILLAASAGLLFMLTLPINAVAASALPSQSRSAAAEAGVGARPASCAAKAPARHARCYLSIEPGGASPLSSPSAACTVSKPAGWSSCNLQDAYGVKQAAKTDGGGNLVAVVDAYDDPNAEADLGTFRSANKLPACTTANGCFEKVNQLGQQANYPTPDAGWAGEISTDLQMVSSICPLCHILLVEANSSGFGDLGTAENEAVALGAHVISNSWGSDEFSGEASYDADWDHPGVDVTFSSGDGSYQGGVQYPSASPYVTSVAAHSSRRPATRGDGRKRRGSTRRAALRRLKDPGAVARLTNLSRPGRRTPVVPTVRPPM